MSDALKLTTEPGEDPILFGESEKEAVRIILDEIETRAEVRIARTGKIAGCHWNALREIRKELGLRRRKS